MPSKRAKKWRIKTSPDLWHPRLEALHELSSSLIAQTYTSIDQLYEYVARILDENGIPANQRLLYRSFVEELWRLRERYSGKTLAIEGGAIVVKYWLYGGERKILYSIARQIGLTPDYLDKVLEEASQMTITEAVKQAVTELYFDEEGVVTWDGPAYGTDEIDISAMFNTPLTGTKRRRYAVFLDFSDIYEDPNWLVCKVRVKIKIDGINYRTIDRRDVRREEVSPEYEQGIPIDIPPISRDAAITLQFDTALESVRQIPYQYVMWYMEL
ncbi:MAG: hypothetical protein DRJ38_10305 [Thermoprotei archaeon]|nr:MAG: hypothetical protein DRJ38_10305 [Thermoprotei archaeon]